MIARLGKLLVAILLVSATAYLLMWNWTTAEVNLIPGRTFSAPTGVILLATFILGLLTSTLASSVLSVRATLRERKLQRQLKRVSQNRQQLLEALAAHQEGEHDLARSITQTVVKNSPDDQLARYLLGDMLLQQGELNLAMQTFENQDITEPLHPALLLKAVYVYQRKGNLIAALGTIHTLLRQGDRPKILALAGEIAVHLKKYDEALEYSRRLELLGHSVQELNATVAYQRLVLGEDKNTPKKIGPVLIESLKSLNTQYPNYVPIMVTLGTLLGEYGDKNEAASFLVQAAQIEDNGAAWLRAVRYWLHLKDGKQAIATAKLGSLLHDKKEKIAGRNLFGKASSKEKVTATLPNEDRLLMTFILALLYLSEGMREEAMDALTKISINNKFALGDLEQTSLPFWLLTAVYQSLFGNTPAAYAALVRGVVGDSSPDQNILTTNTINSAATTA